MIIDTTFARELAADLLEINAVILRPNEPFTWASGWHSPIYCDNRLTLRQPHIRSKIAAKFSEFVTQSAMSFIHSSGSKKRTKKTGINSMRIVLSMFGRRSMMVKILFF